ncbi:hypothetical protein HHI36_005046 [Cryptolaemus montrouzieri]|uniref:Uncharacterized protein n=1 Tax=Cryptolaemus montrouzieri TaxID=559131 RepID=A0ABD2NTE5_9CUCU
MSAFNKARVYPFNSNTISEEDFMPSYLTDHPVTQSQTQTQELLAPETNETNTELQSSGPEIRAPSVNVEVEVETSELLSSPGTVLVTLGPLNNKHNQKSNFEMPSTSKDNAELVRSLPKVGPRKQLDEGQSGMVLFRQTLPKKLRFL